MASQDSIGRIPVPQPPDSGLTWPILPDYPYGYSRSWPIVSHRFGEAATLAVQRYQTGIGPRRFEFRRSSLPLIGKPNDDRSRRALIDFYNACQGSFQPFTYYDPNPTYTTPYRTVSEPITNVGPYDTLGQQLPVGPPLTAANNPAFFATKYKVIFDTAPLSISDFANAVRTGITFVEVPSPDDPTPAYTVANTVLRFPQSAMSDALLSEVQQIIPLLHISVRDAQTNDNLTGVPDLYLSDRRVMIGPQLYLPRLLGIGEEGSDVIMSQSIDGRADNVQFTLGNADRVMSRFVKDTALKYAQIDLSLYHIQSQTVLQLWKGIVISWVGDGTPRFQLQCSDGLYPLTQNYPRRTISHQCWKPFDKEIVPGSGIKPCPYTEQHANLPPTGNGGNPLVCDYFFDSANGCLQHNMSPYFGGHPDLPQSVYIKDNGTGTLFGFGRSRVTSTSVLNVGAYGQALPEIWCNSGGDPLKAFWTNCIVLAVRDESTFEDVLGIVGAGPITQFTVNDPRPGGNVTAVRHGIPQPPGQGGQLPRNLDGQHVLVAPLADNFPAQGFKVDISSNATIAAGLVDETKDNDLGLRQVHGTDPVLPVPDFWRSQFSRTGDQDYKLAGPLRSAYNPSGLSLGQGTPQHWDIPDLPRSDGGGGFTNIDAALLSDPSQIRNAMIPLAAGTAFVELRYPKDPAKGIAPTTAEQHTMSVPIAYGLSGVTFSNGSPSNGVITNPFWVAANTYLRALGLDNADPQTQQDALMLDSISNGAPGVGGQPGTGTGAADIADTQIVPIVGFDPLHPTFVQQFTFQGVLTEFKPFRDWLTEILNCAMGYYLFEFGKLRLGCRFSASDTSAFTLGNMIYQSLSLTPVEAAFEYLKIEFGNQNIQFQLDTAEYTDKDHAEYFGRTGTPLASRMRSVGISTLDQALRIAAMRTREEVGGILRPDLPNPHLEWDNAFMATFRTTILALETEVGQVVSITHPDIPTYPGPSPLSTNVTPQFVLRQNTWNYRIVRWTLHKDWSITIQARSVTDSMYDLTVGPRAPNVLPLPLPILFYPEQLGEWAPYQVIADDVDPIYPSEWTFDVQQRYLTAADGTVSAVIEATGKLPVNEFIPGCGAVDAKAGKVVWSGNGGTIPGGITLRIQICAQDNLLRLSPPSEVIVQQVDPTTNTNGFTISGIVWPKIDNLTAYVVFMSTADDLICEQTFGALTGSASAGYSPVDITVTGGPGPNGALARSTWAVPNPRIKDVVVKAKFLEHGGVLGAGVDSVVGNVVQSNNCIDVTGRDDWTGRVLTVIGRPGRQGQVSSPFTAANIDSFNPLTGTFVLDRIIDIQDGDAFVVCTFGQDNSATPTVIVDTGLVNSLNYDFDTRVPTPFSGLPDSTINPREVGNIIRVLRGVSRGKTAKVVSNDLQSYTVETPLLIQNGDIWIVEGPAWTNQSPISAVPNLNPFVEHSFDVPVDNYLGQSVLIAGFTEDVDANEPGDADAPLRMQYIWGDSFPVDAQYSMQKITLKPGSAVNPGLGTQLRVENIDFVLGGGGLAGPPADLSVYDPATGAGETDGAVVLSSGWVRGWKLDMSTYPPAGADAKFDVVKKVVNPLTGTVTWVSIFNNTGVPPRFPSPSFPDSAGPSPSTDIQVGVPIPGAPMFGRGVYLQVGDTVKGRIMQVGSTTPGKAAHLSLFYA